MASNFKLLMIDLDGTLYIGNQEVPGAVRAIETLRHQNITLRFLTNTTTKTRSQLIEQMRAMGFAVAPEELISAPMGALLELHDIQKKLKKPITIWPLVSESVRDDFQDFVFDEDKPDYVVLGDIGDRWDLRLINQLFRVMNSGAELIALHKNRFWQTQEGLKADIGFFVAGLEYICNKPAIAMGKPNREFFLRVIRSAGVEPHESLMVGDDIDIDVGGAQSLGIAGCLVKTGKYRQAYCDQSSVKPDFMLDSFADITGLIK